MPSSMCASAERGSAARIDFRSAISSSMCWPPENRSAPTRFNRSWMDDCAAEQTTPRTTAQIAWQARRADTTEQQGTNQKTRNTQRQQQAHSHDQHIMALV